MCVINKINIVVPAHRTVVALSHIKLNVRQAHTAERSIKNSHTAPHFKRSNQWCSSNWALDKFIGDQFFDYARIG